LLQVDLKKSFGKNFKWVLLGLREAVERASLTTSCVWFRIVPVLDFHKSLPRIDIKEGKARKNYIKEYQATLPEIKALITESLVLHSSKEGLEDASLAKDPSDAGAAHSSLENSALGKHKVLSQQMGSVAPSAEFVTGHSLLRALVRYAPTLACVSDIFDQHTKARASVVLPVLERWLINMPFTKQADFEALFTLMQRVPSFRSPAVIASVLKNPSSDNEKWHPEIFRLLATCGNENILNDQGEVKADLRKLEFATKASHLC